jgi:hypothetical protein
MFASVNFDTLLFLAYRLANFAVVNLIDDAALLALVFC